MYGMCVQFLSPINFLEKEGEADIVAAELDSLRSQRTGEKVGRVLRRKS